MNPRVKMSLPMAGIRILDFTWGGAGPFATKALADYGAEVIKIETSTHYDFPRTMGPFANGKRGINRSSYFSNRNSNKLGVTLNLKTKEAVQLVKKLVPTCDLMMNNFRAGVLEKAGLGYQDVAELKPDIIYVSMPMQGTAGPQAGYSGVGHTLNALAGIYAMTAYDDGTVVGPGTNFPDHSVNPGHALVAVMAALIHRKNTGRGQHIEVSQLESTVNLLGPSILAYSLDYVDPVPEGNTSPHAAPYGAFPCANDEWMAVSISDDRQWSKLCAIASGQAWASESRFAVAAARLAHAAELKSLVAEWTKTKDALELVKSLQARGVPAGVVQTAKDLVDRDPQLKARGHFVELDHAEMGPTVYNGSPYKLSKTPAQMRRGAPLLGEHNDQVMKGLMGVSDEDMKRMAEAGVFK